MKIRFSLFIVILFFLLSPGIYAQNNSGEYNILFYNVENLFDTVDDKETLDEEFTPAGSRHWTNKRFNRKILNLSKVLLNATGWSPPDIIGLCEVENRYVLEKLLMNTPLRSFSYSMIHKNSPDDRGIDVALLYNTKVFYPLKYQYYPLLNNEDSVIRTREILYVKGIMDKVDTIHIFVNHWPSRYSGLLESRPRRILAAKTLRCEIDRLFDGYDDPKILVLGDFNDQPWDESLSSFLKTADFSGEPKAKCLYNLSYSWNKGGEGTLKYQGQWLVFDQIIISGALIEAKKGLFAEPGFESIIKLPFLLESDTKYGGLRLKRTYTGYKYAGGFSDHLPVILRLKLIP
jgi:endonuclease/exonuclease/phosphatase family metal-dependent hydrolase